jgi:uncharacterized membrane protein YphA (DoxX/SURF4 family)
VARLHSGFPGRAPGAGLLLLRIAVGAALVVYTVPSISDANDPSLSSFVLGLLALVVGASLIVGILTRTAAILGAVLTGAIIRRWVMTSPIHSLRGNPLILNVIIIDVAIALLGPGAFSLDAVLFGRRRIIIPHSPLSRR